MTLTVAAGVPDGYVLRVTNLGPDSNLSILPSGGETINQEVSGELVENQTAELIKSGSDWDQYTAS